MTNDGHLSRDWYAVLGVARDAEAEVVRAAYKALARKHHPDVGGDQARMSDVLQAYEAISDPVRRSDLDRRLREQERPAPSRPAEAEPAPHPAPPPQPTSAPAAVPQSLRWRDLLLSESVPVVVWVVSLLAALAGVAVVAFHVSEYVTALPWFACLLVLLALVTKPKTATAFGIWALLWLLSAFGLASVAEELVPAAALMAPVPMVPVAQWALAIGALAAVAAAQCRARAVEVLEQLVR